MALQLLSALPISKVGYAGIAGAITSLVVWGLSTFVDVQLPAEAAAAITTLITFAIGYVVPLKEEEVKFK